MAAKRITGCILILVICLCGIAMGEETSMNAYQLYLQTGEAPSLYQKYEDSFFIGAAISPYWLGQPQAVDIITHNFNSVTCENEMKADFVLDYNATIALGDEERVVLNFARADLVLRFAAENGIKVRAHTLVWHSQTPRWLFAEGFSKKSDAPLVSRDVMLKRMENYICDYITYLNTAYPGLVYALDVVNEAIEPSDKHPLGYRTTGNLWYQTLGDDFIELAFAFARQYAAPDQKLFYNDYSCFDNAKLFRIRALLKDLYSKGLLDGLGMQSHLGMDSPSLTDFETALSTYASLGIEIQITEFDVTQTDGSLLGEMALAVRYRRFFMMLDRLKNRAGLKITSVTVWGMTDNRSWLNNSERTCYPLLFSKDYAYKATFFGALQDASIPLSAMAADLQKALDQLGLAQPERVEGMPGTKHVDESGLAVALKPITDHNPVMAQRFGADPYALVYDGRVYLYMTGDALEYDASGAVKNNTYSTIPSM